MKRETRKNTSILYKNENNKNMIMFHRNIYISVESTIMCINTNIFNRNTEIFDKSTNVYKRKDIFNKTS